MNKIFLELKKELKSKSFLITLIFVFIMTFLFVYLSSKNNVDKFNAYQQLEQDFFKDDSVYKYYLINYNESIVINNYLNDHFNKSLYILQNSYTIILFLSFALAITCGTLISNEYENGTIKCIIDKYKSRNQFLLVKICVSILLCTIYVLSTIFLILLFVTIINKINIFSLKYPFLLNNSIILKNYLLYYIKMCFMNSIPLYFVSIISCLLSALIKKSVVVVFVISLLVTISPTISSILFNLNYNFIEYTFLPYLDYTIFNDSFNILTNNIIYDIRLSAIKGVIILFATSIFILIVSLYLINKSDIKV